MAANLVVLGYLVFANGPIGAIVVAAVAAAGLLTVLAWSARQFPSSDSSLVASPSPLISLEPSSFLKPPDVRESMPGADPLENKPWLKLIEECVDLYDELDRLQPSLEAAAQELVDHCRCRVLEILERSGVSIFAEDATFDRSRHQADVTQERPREGTPIEATLSPGFAVGRRVFRRARVKLTESIVPTEEPSP
jgi:hypothetical protein